MHAHSPDAHPRALTLGSCPWIGAVVGDTAAAAAARAAEAEEGVSQTVDSVECVCHASLVACGRSSPSAAGNGRVSSKGDVAPACDSRYSYRREKTKGAARDVGHCLGEVADDVAARVSAADEEARATTHNMQVGTGRVLSKRQDTRARVQGSQHTLSRW